MSPHLYKRYHCTIFTSKSVSYSEQIARDIGLVSLQVQWITKRNNLTRYDLFSFHVKLITRSYKHKIFNIIFKTLNYFICYRNRRVNLGTLRSGTDPTFLFQRIRLIALPSLRRFLTKGFRFWLTNCEQLQNRSGPPYAREKYQNDDIQALIKSKQIITQFCNFLHWQQYYLRIWFFFKYKLICPRSNIIHFLSILLNG